MADDKSTEDAAQHDPEAATEAMLPPRRRMGSVDESFYVIGIGASAGGLEAIKALIAQVPEGFQHSFVIIQHLSPDHESLMTEILRRDTALTVLEVTDNLTIEPGHIYLIPPRWNVVIQGTSDDTAFSTQDRVAPWSGLRFSLVAMGPRDKLNLPIDLFFHSLAEAAGQRSVGIILSGTGSDGSRGLRSIKDSDGFVMVQEPATAAFDGMPVAAIATNLVDQVQATDQMIPELQRYFHMREVGFGDVAKLFDDAEEDYAALLALVREQVDFDFGEYKDATLKRRIARRMWLTHRLTVGKYVAYAKDHPTELAILYREFLVGVTNFFRDLPFWKRLEQAVVPKLFTEGRLDEPLKVWSIGCSTGEEAYTLAMILETYRMEHGVSRDFKIIATDVNKAALEAGKEGIYSITASEEIPERYLRREFFSYTGNAVQFSGTLRRKIVFAPHNAIVDAPYIRTDLVVCRNMLIYLTAEVQTQIFAMLSFSLRRGGYMFLGAAEAIVRERFGFEPVDARARIYVNANKAEHGRIRGYLDRQMSAPVVPRSRTSTKAVAPHDDPRTANVLRYLTDQLDCCVLILDPEGKVIQTFGPYQKYLSLPKTGFSSSVLDLMEDGIRASLVLLMRRADRDGKARKTGLALTRDDGETFLFDAICEKIVGSDLQPTIMLTLNPTPGDVFSELERAENRTDDASEAIVALEREIASLQELLTVTTEDLGIANEQLQTTNEELVTANEELQANNEEMQSTNEELHTINMENVERITELEEAYTDIENLLNNWDLAILFLDDDLRIRRFSSGMTRYFTLQKTDVGRSITAFRSELTNDSMELLMADIAAVRTKGETRNRDLQRRDGGTCIMMLRPFESESDAATGLVLKFIDVTELTDLQAQVRRQRDALEALLETEISGYFDWDIPGGTEYFSPRFKAMLGYSDAEFPDVPESWMSVIHPDDKQILLNNFEAHVTSRGAVAYNQEVRYLHKDGREIWVLCRGHVTDWSEEGEPLRMMGVHVDINDLKRRELDVQRNAEEVRRFAFIAAHDLMQPANTIENALSALTEDYTDAADGEQRQLLTFATAASSRLKRRIAGVLDYARLQETSEDMAVLDLTTLTQQCLADLGDQVKDSGAQVDMAPLPLVMGIESLLLQVLQNILSNSMKYRRHDRPCRISMSECHAMPGFVGIRIADNGIGIPREYRDKVLELFTRLHSETEYPGNGLGLALCDRIVSMHGGHIEISDGIDGGTAVIVSLKPAPG